MRDTQLIFVIGSGRCGTKAIAKMMAGVDGIEAHHEYCRYAYQREAVLSYLGKYPPSWMYVWFQDIYDSAAYYSEQPIFLDSSHKLVPVVNILAERFPTAKFIHLVRDGRKVCTSFFYKLQIHDDRAARILKEWIDNPDLPIPPPSEKYWHIPAPYEDRWQRICWWWQESVSLVENIRNAKHYPTYCSVRLEDLIADDFELKKLVDFIGVPYDESFYQFLQKPDHVYVPINYSMTPEQSSQFWSICGDTMKYYGYDSERESDVGYY